jgi:hypothetical protein
LDIASIRGAFRIFAYVFEGGAIASFFIVLWLLFEGERAKGVAEFMSRSKR